jgi:hypothetical protein
MPRSLLALNNPYPNGMLLPPGRSLGDWTFIGLGVSTILPSNNRNPEYHSWNLSIQRELPFQSVLEINYTGSRGTHLFLPFTSLTPLHPQYWSLGPHGADERGAQSVLWDHHRSQGDQLEPPTVQLFRLLRPMPQFDGASVGTAEPPRADSYYHALQVKWEKRYSKGLTTLAHYTWSKMIDNASHGSGNLQLAGRLDQPPVHLEPAAGAVAFGPRRGAPGGADWGLGDAVRQGPQVGFELEPAAGLGSWRLGNQRHGDPPKRHAPPSDSGRR